MNNHQYCVIMAGGIGSRFWPVSRSAKPKQFLDFGNSGRSFLQETYDRMATVVPEENILVVTLERYKDIVNEQLPQLRAENLLLEPYNRNTAPCITFAAYELIKRDPESVMAVVPTDHEISTLEQFQETMSEALEYATTNPVLVTLGIEPTRPDTNFGYIQVSGGSQARRSGNPVKVKTFTEKPDRELAEVFLKTGEFLWNSGIFVWQTSVILEELQKHAPLITSLWSGNDSIQVIYGDCPKTSIDYAVMEKTERAMVIPAKFSWADIGTWSSLYEYMAELDENGNATKVMGKHILKDNSGSIVFESREDKLIAVKGLKDFVVVDTGKVLMICPRDDKQIKDFLADIAGPGYEDFR